MEKLFGKLKESVTSVLPIVGIVMVLHFTVAPMPAGTLWLFLSGSVFLMIGMAFFNLGADVAMVPMGEQIGAQLIKSRRTGLLIMACLVMGIFITIAEPDLQVLAKQVPSIPSVTLILSVAVGVGIFLVISLLRILLKLDLSHVLITFYIIVFVLAIFASEDYLSVAFDSGGVTTGPITVPFILALGVGLSSVRGGKSSHDDSFGLVALCSIGPILAVTLLGIFFKSGEITYESVGGVSVNSLSDFSHMYQEGFHDYFMEVAQALLPIIVFFVIFQLTALKLPKSQLIKTSVGVLYTFLGLVLFLTGVNVGFLPAGNYIGGIIGGSSISWILIPLGMLMGFFIVAAEPAVHVLNNQVEFLTGGSISKRSMMISLSLGVAVSIGLAMIRVLTGISIWYILIPGYLAALIMTFFVPKIFTAIAFDSGGVASGPMTATFLLPFAMGACEAMGGNVMRDAFGIVAMVAMTPLIAVQVMGVSYQIKLKRSERDEAAKIDLDSAVEEAKAKMLEDLLMDNVFIDLEKDDPYFKKYDAEA